MFSKIWTSKSTDDYSQSIKRLKTELQSADAILVGAGSGLSTSAGLTYSGKRFLKYFSDFHAKYGITDIYSGGFYPFSSPEEYWAWWSRHIYYNRYAEEPGKPYMDLLSLMKGKDYFVLTTNVDHQFQLAGFDKQRLFYTQGDYGLWQCSKPCHQATYDNEAAVRQMIEQQQDMMIPTALIPCCPKCGRPMTMNLRSDNTFVQDEGWYAASKRYEQFIQSIDGKHVLFLELGVGGNTPVIIKYPFLQMTYRNPNAVYVCINLGEAMTAKEVVDRSIVIEADIGVVLTELAN